jgi:hypothetical protein
MGQWNYILKMHVWGDVYGVVGSQSMQRNAWLMAYLLRFLLLEREKLQWLSLGDKLQFFSLSASHYTEYMSRKKPLIPSRPSHTQDWLSLRAKTMVPPNGWQPLNYLKWGEQQNHASRRQWSTNAIYNSYIKRLNAVIILRSESWLQFRDLNSLDPYTACI